MMYKAAKKAVESINDKYTTVNTGTTSAPALSRNRNRSVYLEVLDKLKTDFHDRFSLICSSSNQGLEEYTFIRTLGTGSFGRVSLAKRKENDDDVYYAIKVIEKLLIMKLRQVEHTLYEKKILVAIRFPFIINMKACFKDNSYIYFVLPYINGGEMFTHLRRMNRFSEVLSKFYSTQVILGLEFLHHCDIIYRDLKPENILIDQTGYIKITDLGFCKIVKGRTWTFCGTPEYIAPEIILSRGYGQAVDWWSLGVLMYEMNAGFPAFTSNDPMRVYEKIIIAKYKFPGYFSTDLQDLIKNLLQVDLSRRYGNLKNGTQDIKNHKWFKDTDWLAVYNRHVEPPFKPLVKTPSDTTNFDTYEDQPLKISERVLFYEDFALF